jgi:phage terminase large subunit-like protein
LHFDGQTRPRFLQAEACGAYVTKPDGSMEGAVEYVLVIEESGISYGLIQALREQHINVVDYKPKGEKEERLISQIDLFEGGSVLLPKEAPWLEAAG